MSATERPASAELRQAAETLRARAGAASTGDGPTLSREWLHDLTYALADLMERMSEGACCDDCIEDPGADPMRNKSLVLARLINGGQS